MPSFAATRLAASVLLTSPTTSTARGRRSMKSRSSPTITLPVCSAWLPEPTPRFDDRARHAQVLEEDLRHRLVVVLAGVDYLVGDAGRREGGVDGRRLHEVRPPADDGEDHTRPSAVDLVSTPSGRVPLLRPSTARTKPPSSATFASQVSLAMASLRRRRITGSSAAIASSHARTKSSGERATRTDSE